MTEPACTWIANLDAAADHARLDATWRDGPPATDSRWRTSQNALRRSAALGTLFGLLAAPGDGLVLDAAVDAERLPDVPHCTRADVGVITENVRRWSAVDAAATRANDRSGWAQLGVSVPGARVIHDASELRACPGNWVLKAPFGAAGRRRALGTTATDGTIADHQVAAARRLLTLFGRGVLEPWLERTVDVGLSAPSPQGAVQIHTLQASGDGRFLGIDTRSPPEWNAAFEEQLLEVAETVGQRLLSLGYDDRFGLDGFLFRQADTLRLAVCEVNARWTFGALTRALARRVFGSAVPARLVLDRSSPSDAVPLLLPSSADPIGAWLLRS